MADHSYVSRVKRIKRNLKGTQCYALTCVNYKNSTSRQEGTSFHKFPDKSKEPERYAVWVRNCCRQGVPSKNALVCSKHFEEKWMDRTGQIIRLRADAVPTIFNVPSYLQSRIIKCTPSIAKNISEDVQNCEEVKKMDADNGKHPLTTSVAQDHNYDVGQLDKLKRKLYDMHQQMEALKKKARNARVREHRAKKICEGYLKEMQRQSLLMTKLKQKHDLSNIPQDTG